MKDVYKYLDKLLEEIFVETGYSMNLKKSLGNFVKLINNYPLSFWKDDIITSLSKASLRVLICDIIDEEEKEIQWANMSYALVTKALVLEIKGSQDPIKIVDILKDRVILMHSHNEFFIDTLDYFFFHNKEIVKHSSPNERRAFVLKKVASMLIKDLHILEAFCKDFNNDALLLDIEQETLEKYQFDKKELAEAELLSDVLFKYNWSRKY